MELYRIEEPKTLAVDISEVANALGMEVPTNLIQRAIECVEEETGECLIRQCWILYLHKFPGRRDPIDFPVGPFLSARVLYRDIEGELLECKSGDLVIKARQGGFTIEPADSMCWSRTQVGNPHPVEVIAWVGMGDSPDVVPREMKQRIFQAIRDTLMAEECDEDRPVET